FRLRLYPTPYTQRAILFGVAPGLLNPSLRERIWFSYLRPSAAKSEAGEQPRSLFQAKTPLVWGACTSCRSPRHEVAGFPGNGDANKFLDQRDGHDYASTVLVLKHDSAFVGLQYAAPVD